MIRKFGIFVLTVLAVLSLVSKPLIADTEQNYKVYSFVEENK